MLTRWRAISDERTEAAESAGPVAAVAVVVEFVALTLADTGYPRSSTWGTETPISAAILCRKSPRGNSRLGQKPVLAAEHTAEFAFVAAGTPEQTGVERAEAEQIAAHAAKTVELASAAAVVVAAAAAAAVEPQTPGLPDPQAWRPQELAPT